MECRSQLDKEIQEGDTYQQQISELLNNYTSKTEMNKEHIAFELLNNDPLDETSVEYLCAQNEIWLERVK